MNTLTALLLALAQDAVLAPDAWTNAGDADGDGLRDDFEIAQGLDPAKADSFGDGVADENRLAPDGRTLWEVQKASAAAPSGDGGGGACGAMGLDALILLALLHRRRI